MAPEKKIIINCEEGEKRIAFVEDNELTGFMVDRENKEKFSGNIYIGVVKNILPGIEAAFVDIGIGKNGFLHFSDIEADETEDYEDENDEGGAEQPAAAEGQNNQRRHHPHNRNRRHQPAPVQLKVGQEILVQVIKEQIGEKGVKLSAAVSLPGRFIVFMPNSSTRGISKRISNGADRAQLRDLVRELPLPKNVGIIIRTVSKGCTRENILQEVRFLNKIWRHIKISRLRAKAPACLYENLPLTFQVVRDNLTEDVNEVQVDDAGEYKRIMRFVDSSFPSYKERIQHYTNKMPIFAHFNLDKEIEKALRRKIWLRNGGYLIIDRTEALVAIDVNTGRSSGKGSSPEETILRCNVEAAKEIARQLQIRNIGGIIIIDFIDMHRPEHRKRVLQVFQSAVAQDKAKIKIYPISRLGLIEMTRQRTKETIGSEIHVRCPACDGLGVVKSVKSIWYDLIHDLKKIGATADEKRVKIVFHNKMLITEILGQIHVVKKIEKSCGMRMALEPSDTPLETDYEIYSVTNGAKLA